MLKLRENPEVLSISYKLELNKARDELMESLYKLSETLHPNFLFTKGSEGTLNDLNWLIKHRGELEKQSSKFKYKLQRFSERIAETIFGEYLSSIFENELTYFVSSSSFKKMKINSFVKNKELILDLPVGKVCYKFFPLTEMRKETGKILDEYYIGNELKVKIGLRPSVFRSISGIVVPIHEVIHHVSTLYNPGAYESALIKSFERSFKNIPFSLDFKDGILFGSVSEDLRKNGIDLSGKDILDPFSLLEIVKRYGNKISSILKVPVCELEDSCLNFFEESLKFRSLEEGIACILSIENASLEKVPLKFSGLENSLREIVNFGAKLKKFEYLESGIDFYTGKKIFSPYLIPEIQLYPFSYISHLEKFKGKSLIECLNIARNFYLENGIKFSERKIRKESESKDNLVEEVNSVLREYRKKIEEMDKIIEEYRKKCESDYLINFFAYLFARTFELLT